MRHRPLLIGVVGGSGSGKSTVARAIYDFLGRDAAFIDQDAYYLDLAHLSRDERRLVNFDHPHAFDTDLLVQHPRRLQAWEPIQKPTYDFAAHTRAEAVVEIIPRDVILVDGILLFADARLRSLFGLSTGPRLMPSSTASLRSSMVQPMCQRRMTRRLLAVAKLMWAQRKALPNARI